MFRKFSFAFILFVLCSFFSTSAFAQADASGFEIKVAATAPILLYDTNVDNFATFYGAGLNLAVGYRWQYFGAYIDQDFSGIFAVDTHNKYQGHFVGAFHFMGRGVFAVSPSFLFYGGFGLGFMYGSEDSRHRLGLAKNEVIFSLKAQVGFSYFLNERLSIGLDFSYSYAFAKITEVLGVAIDLRHDFHILTPNFHVDFNF